MAYSIPYGLDWQPQSIPKFLAFDAPSMGADPGDLAAALAGDSYKVLSWPLTWTLKIEKIRTCKVRISMNEYTYKTYIYNQLQSYINTCIYIYIYIHIHVYIIYICIYIYSIYNWYMYIHICLYHTLKYSTLYYHILHIPWNPWLGTTCVPQAAVVLGSEPVGPMRRCAAAAGIDMCMNIHGKFENVLVFI